MRLRTAVPMMLLLLLCACGAGKESAQTPVSFRTALCGAGGCSFQLALKADYEEYTREFTLVCQSQVAGETSLTVQSPQNAEGITATVSGDSADVSYGDTVLAVENFETRRISPMAAPFLLTKAWSEGYISACGQDGCVGAGDLCAGLRESATDGHYQLRWGDAGLGRNFGWGTYTDHL